MKDGNGSDIIHSTLQLSPVFITIYNIYYVYCQYRVINAGGDDKFNWSTLKLIRYTIII